MSEKTANLQLQVDGTVLDTPVVVVFQKKKTKVKIVDNSLKPKTGVDCTLTETTFLTYGKQVSGAAGKSLDDFWTDLQKKFTTKPEDKANIENLVKENTGKGGAGSDIMKGLSLSIKQIYFSSKSASLSIIKTGTTSTDKDTETANETALKALVTPKGGVYTDNKATQALIDAGQLEKENTEITKAKSKDYALWINLSIAPELMEGLPVVVENVSFKMWSTKNTEVLKEMELEKMQKMLAAATPTA